MVSFTEEDQDWILKASKDLDVSQISIILGVSEIDIENFLKANVVIKKDQRNLITKDFLKDRIKNGFSQNETAEELGLTLNQIVWILRKKYNLSWENLKKEIATQKEFISFKCSNCGIEKDKNQFYIRKQSKTGYSSWCRSCNKEVCKKRYISKRVIYG